ncbi:MAG TPA: type II secretion system protein [Burkholderiales bacterium]|nr:type II secretion system protein [Burkholderiales bacterium]
MKKNAGFTLIELVAVMVILAILAVVAIPQFVDLRVQAANASAAGVGGAIASGTALNYARGVGAGAGAVAVTACSGTQLAPMIGGVTSSTATTIVLNGRTYNIASVTAPVGSGGSGTCSIEDSVPAAATPQNFTIISCTPAATC